MLEAVIRLIEISIRFWTPFIDFQDNIVRFWTLLLDLRHYCPNLDTDG